MIKLESNHPHALRILNRCAQDENPRRGARGAAAFRAKYTRTHVVRSAGPWNPLRYGYGVHASVVPENGRGWMWI